MKVEAARAIASLGFYENEEYTIKRVREILKKKENRIKLRKRDHNTKSDITIKE